MGNREKGKVILIFDEPKYFIPFFKKKGLLVYPLFKELSTPLRLLRKLFFILKLPKNIWYAEWNQKLDKNTTIIIFSVIYTEVLHYINNLNTGARVIFWYWNPAFRSVNPDDIPGTLCEKWSFDEDDCVRYEMKYNSTFFPGNVKLPENNIDYDAIFLGLDKGRKAAIDSFKDNMLAAGLRTDFTIIDDNSKEKRVPYTAYLTQLSKSNAILDFIQEGQRGLSQRPMESIFFQKKLITNDVNIAKRDFYDSHNIFILGVDNIESLKNFLTTPYKPVPKEILEYYDVSNWAKRFVE